MNTDGDVLFVCSGGGHLRQLAGFADRLGIEKEQQVWVTFRNGLSESLLADRRVEYVPFTAPRDLRHFSQLVARAPKILKRYRLRAAISTGSSPAVAFLPLAAMSGISSHYIESAARADGPSMTGKMISRFPGIHTYCQYPAWAGRRWQYRGSTFDKYEPGDPIPERVPRKVVVSVGTQEGYPFPRLFRAVAPLLSQVDDVLYQTGDTDVSEFGITGRVSLPYSELKDAMKDADVVISHAGVGGAVTALELGKHPILIPREVAHREHVDDHQFQVARELDRRGLATMRTPANLTFGDLVNAGRQTVRTTTAPHFDLALPDRVRQ